MKSVLIVCSVMLFTMLVFADIWLDTTTSDFNTAGSSASNTQVINDTVQLAEQFGWWKTSVDWWNTDWLYRRPITITNNGSSILTDYQVLVEPFRDSGDFIENNLSGFGSGPAAYWPFSEGAGTTTADTIGGNTGTLVNSPIWNTGRYGNAISFNGTSNYLEVLDNASIRPTGEMSIEMWAYIPSLGTSYCAIQKHNVAGDTGWSFFFYGTDNKFYFQLGNGGGGWPGYNLGASEAITSPGWYHVVGTHDAVSHRIYVNGIQKGSMAGGTISQNTSNLWIGRNPDTPAIYYSGLIDEVRIYNRSLTAEEISIRYGSGLVGSWHFSEGAGTATSDMSCYGNNGTLVNSPTWSASGRFGSALSFDGSNDYVALGTPPNLQFTSPSSTPFCVEAWIKRGDLNREQNIIGSGGGNSSWIFYVKATNKLAFGRTGVSEIVDTGTAIADTSSWHHVAVMYNGSYANFYLDGRFNSSLSYSATFASTEKMIGGHFSSYYWNGLIDEVRIYSRILSSSEINYRYNSGAPKYRQDFADIRFITTSGTELSFWQETDSRFWVKVPSLASGSNTIQMYYGNSSATALSDGANTFDFFDSFDGISLDTTNKWTVNTGDQSVSTGGITLGSSGSTYIRTIATFPVDRIARAKVKVNSAGTGDSGYVGFSDGTGRPVGSVSNNVATGFTYSSLTVGYLDSAISSSSYTEQAATFLSRSQYSITELWRVSNTSIKLYQNNILLQTNTTNISSVSIPAVMGRLNTGATVYDYFLIRKYAAVEPAHTLPGAEAYAFLSNSNGGSWQYSRTVAVSNSSGSTLTNYVMSIEPFRDTGDFIGNNIDNAGLVGVWPLDEGTGTSVADTSGNGNSGTLTNGPLWRTGKYGNAVLFDGSDDYVNLGNSSSLNIMADISIEAWIMPASTSTKCYAVTKSSNSYAEPFFQYGLNYDNNVNDSFEFNLGLNGANRSCGAGFTSAINAWYHVVGTYNRTTGDMKIYVNGRLAGTANYGAYNMDTSTAPLLIGKLNTSSSNLFSGQIDEVRIYTRVLSADEVSLHYGSGLAGSWHFSEGSGITTADMSGNGNNGTLTNNPVWEDGRFGNALLFDGVDDYITIADGSSLDIPSAVTIEGWIFAYQWTNSYPRLLNKTTNYDIWFDGTNADALGKPSFRINGTTFVSGDSGLDTNTWYYIAATYDQETGDLKMYVNGQLKNTNSAGAGTSLITNTASLMIGNVSGLTRTFTGLIDEVRIYNRALSASEIAVRYNSDTPKYRYDFADIRFTNSDSTQELSFYQETDTRFRVKIPALAAGSNTILIYYGNSLAINSSNLSDVYGSSIVGFWPFTEGTGTSAYDRSGNSNSGTLTNNPTWTTGKFGNGIYFDGTDDYVSLGASSNLDVYTGEFSIETWFNMSSASLMNRALFVSGASDDKGIGFFINRGLGGVNGNAVNLQKGEVIDQAVTYNFNANTWYHVVAVQKFGGGVPSQVDYYVNGSYVNSYTNSSAYVSAAGLTKGIGIKQAPVANENYFQGLIDEMRIYNRTLSAAEIASKYTIVEPTHSVPGSELTQYSANGTFISAAKDTGGNDTWMDSVGWTALGAGTITMQMRADNSEPAGWTSSVPAWEDVDNGDTSVAVTGRYLQYRATLTGTGLTAEPVLTDVTVTYTVPIVPPADSLSCDKLTNNWYSTAVFTFTNNTSFGTQINKYYYVWDTNISYSSYSGAESQWTTDVLALDAVSDGSWYLHFLPYSSTDTAGTAQDLGPFRYDGTAPAAVTFQLPVNNSSVSETTTAFSWDAVTDLSGVSYTLQLDNYTSFSSPVINKSNLSDLSYTMSGTGAEVLIGNSTYYWRVVVIDGAGNTTNGDYRKFTTTSSVPQLVNESTGETYPDIQSAINSASTVNGDVINVKDTIAHNENITISKDVILENAVLSPSSGFAITGQGPAGGEILRNCVITKGGVSDLAMGENLTLFNPDPSVVLTIENSKLVNCLIENGAVITNSILENCYAETTADYFVDAAGGDFHLSNTAVNAIDLGKNLGVEFTDDMDGAERGIDVWEMPNFDVAAWDIGAYELLITGGYINPPQAPSVPVAYYPAGGTDGFNTDIALIWYPSTGSTPIKYAVQISTLPDMSNPYYSAANIADTFAEISGLSYDTIYYWQVKASNGAGDSAWSSIYDFITLTETSAADTLEPLSVPALSYPEDDASSLDNSIVLAWYPSIGTAPVTYSLELALSENMALVLYAFDDLENTFLQVSNLPYDMPLYWRVKAVNSDEESNWSSIYQFTVSSEGEGIAGAVPDAPELSSPANGAELTGLPVTFQWYELSEAGITYEFQASTDADFAALTADYTNITGNTLTPSLVFSYNINYYWRIRARNGAGYSSWSSVRAFTATKSGYTTISSQTDHNTSDNASESISQDTIRQKGGCFIKNLKQQLD